MALFTSKIMSDEAESEIYRVNKLLAIEDLDWRLQLEKAVGFFSRSRHGLVFIRAMAARLLASKILISLYFTGVGFQGQWSYSLGRWLCTTKI